MHIECEESVIPAANLKSYCNLSQIEGVGIQWRLSRGEGSEGIEGHSCVCISLSGGKSESVCGASACMHDVKEQLKAWRHTFNTKCSAALSNKESASFAPKLRKNNDNLTLSSS